MDELDLTDAEKKATYQEIKDYVLEQTGLKVSALYIVQVKRRTALLSGRTTIKPSLRIPDSRNAHWKRKRSSQRN
jgi:23S rRNA (uracil1939-C5)-methyltransferase